MDRIVIESARAVARVHGEGPLDFLHATLSQDVEHLASGRGALACLLDDKAHVLGELRVLALEGGDVLVDGEPDARPAIDYLARVAPLSGCEVTFEDVVVTAVRGDDALLAGPLPRREHDHVARGDATVARVEWGVPGFDVIGSLPLEAARTSQEAFDAARIAAGRPLYGTDVTDAMLVNETPYLARAVSFTKGCYPGQESVARVHNLGRVRRRVVGLTLTSPAGAGAVVMLDGAEAGRITSAAGSHAIAYVRAEALDGGDVTVEGRQATVRALA